MLLALAIAGLFFIPDPWRVILLLVAGIVEIAEVYFGSASCAVTG